MVWPHVGRKRNARRKSYSGEGKTVELPRIAAQARQKGTLRQMREEQGHTVIRRFSMLVSLCAGKWKASELRPSEQLEFQSRWGSGGCKGRVLGKKSVVRVTQLETGTMGLETGVECRLSSRDGKKNRSVTQRTAQLHLKAIP